MEKICIVGRLRENKLTDLIPAISVFAGGDIF